MCYCVVFIFWGLLLLIMDVVDLTAVLYLYIFTLLLKVLILLFFIIMDLVFIRFLFDQVNVSFMYYFDFLWGFGVSPLCCCC